MASTTKRLLEVDDEADSLRLLLHTKDGVVPYLTPSLLHKCFPPVEPLAKQMWIGIAVRDTCVHAVHKDGNDPLTSNPRGYTFSDPKYEVDEWMKKYTRFTVPSFDLVQDSVEQTCDGHMSNYVAHSTDKHLMLWTPHGRQAISPDEYYQSCHRLNSTFAVSLYDVPPRNGSTKSMQKHRAASSRRTQSWCESFQLACQNDQWKPELWVPITVHIDVSEADIKTAISSCARGGEIVSIRGVALTGWNELLVEHRTRLLEAAISTHYPIAVLSTRSLRDILELCSQQVALIGSNLPAVWAQQKRVFLLHLPDISDGKRRRSDGMQERFVHLLDEDGCFPLASVKENNDVSGHSWYRDKSPLLKGCRCLTCQSHR